MSGTKRISALTELASGSVDEDDILAIVDMSQAAVTDKTKHVKVKNLIAVGGRLEIDSFAELATKFVSASPSSTQQIAATNDIVVWREKGFRYQCVTSGEHLDYTGSGGLKWKVLPLANGYDVKAFGATGDGVTDDTAALSIAAGISANSTLIVSTGTYAVSDSVTFAQSQIKVTGRGAKIVQSGATKKTFNFDTVSDVEVSGIWFVGKGTEHNGAGTSFNGVAGVYFDTCSNVSVHHCKFTNHAGGSIRWGGSADNFRFHNNYIAGIGSAGGISSGDNNSDFAIAGFGSSGDDNIVVTGNDISGHCFGVGMTTTNNCVVASNVIHDIPGQHGMYISSPHRISITGNALYNIANEGIKCQIASSSITKDTVSITGNSINGTGQSGMSLGTTTVVSGSSITGLIVSGNSIIDCGTYGLSIRQVNDANIVNNVIRDIDAYGIYCDEVNGTISGNIVASCEWSALWLELNEDSYVCNNTFKNAVINVAAEGAQARNLYYVYASKGSTAATDPRLFFSGNIMELEGAAPTNFSSSGKCVRTATGVLVFWDGNTNLTTKGWQFNTSGELKSINIGYSPSVGYTAAGNQSPTTPIYGRGRRELFGTQSPASASMTDSFVRGDICWNADTSTAGNVVGWVCVTAGAPGTWQSFGNVTRLSTTANRPTLTASDIGVLYLDTTLDADGKPIWWTGTAWVDATGATV